MTGNEGALSPYDHIVRYVGRDNLNDDGSVDGGAFRRKPNETRPSVNWLEAFKGSKAEQVQQIRGVIRLNLGTFGKFAELKVGDLVEYVAGVADLRVVSVPLPATAESPADESHAEIDGYPPGDDEKIVCDLLAECVAAVYPAKGDG